MPKTSDKIISWKGPVLDLASLPLSGNSLGDVRVVADDGTGDPSLYICVSTSGIVSEQWQKMTTNSAVVYWKEPVANKFSLPLVDNTLGDARAVGDDGDGNPAVYLCIATTGDVDAQWVKVADVDWGDIFEAGVNNNDLVKRSGTKLAKVTGISELLIVSAQELISFTNDVNVVEIGATVNSVNLNWAYNRDSDDPNSQTIDNGIGSIATNLRATVYNTPFTTNKTFTITAIGDDGNETSLGTTVYFRNKRYWGAYNAVITTGAQVLANLSGSEFGTSKAVEKTFDASAGTPPNYLYFCYPKSWGLPSSTKFGGFTFSDYTVTEISLTNAQGHTEEYYLLRTNNTYNSSGLTWQIL